MNKLDENLSFPDDSDIGYFSELDLRHPDDTKEKKRISHLLLKIKLIPKIIIAIICTKYNLRIVQKQKKTICGWTEKKNYLVQYNKVHFYVEHGMIVDKIHEKISFNKSKCLGKYKNFNTQKRNKAKNDFEKIFYELLNNACFYEHEFLFCMDRQ